MKITELVHWTLVALAVALLAAGLVSGAWPLTLAACVLALSVYLDSCRGGRR